MLLKKLYFKKLQLFSFLFLILFYSFASSKVIAFNPDDYEPDYSQKHNVLDWRHSDGHTFSDNARVFYGLLGIKPIPCDSYKEFVNANHLIKNTALIASNFVPIPGFKKVVSLGFDAKDEFLPSSKIAMFNDVLDYHLNSNVEQGFFFF